MIKRCFATVLAFTVPFVLFCVTFWGDPGGGRLIWVTLLIPPIAALCLLFVPQRLSGISAASIYCVIAVHVAVVFCLAVAFRGIAMPFATILADLTILLSIPTKFQGHTKKALRWSVVVFFCLVTVWSSLNIVAVVWRAEKIAQGHPYCIQVVTEADFDENLGYFSPRRLVDFFGLKMLAEESCGGISGHCFTMQHHAILILNGQEKKYLNWSFWKQNFVDEVKDRRIGRHPPQRCLPERHFALRLPFVFADKGKEE